MISDVDDALRRLIEQEAVDDAEVDVVFDAPTKDWAARRTGPTVDVYLYDIREDLRRRQRGLVNEYDNGRVRARHLPPPLFQALLSRCRMDPTPRGRTSPPRSIAGLLPPPRRTAR